MSSHTQPGLPTTDISLLEEKANLVRKWCLSSTTEAGSGHPTSCLSAADITTVLFDKYFSYDLKQPLSRNNDRFVLSKGHAAPLLYTLFGLSNAYDINDIKTLRRYGSKFEGHPVPKFEYTEAATGSLGQGLSVAAGLALVAKRENLPFKTYALMGDGELAEGQIWEAANFASYNKLDNLIAILDINRLAQSGPTMFGHDMEQYASRFASFGFEVRVINGHDFDEIDEALSAGVANTSEKPFVIVAETIKGKGISFLEDKDGWHGKALKKEELEKALEELDSPNESLRFELKKPKGSAVPSRTTRDLNIIIPFDQTKEYATREVFGEALTALGKEDDQIYALDGDVKNSTFTIDFFKAYPERFIECYIAEQNMVSVAVGLSRIGKIPFVGTFGAFLTRAADQIRMARVSEANVKFVGSHVGVSIGEDGPSQMALEDIAMFGAIPDSVILQPSDGPSTAQLVTEMINHHGFVYMRTLRPKTKVLYNEKDKVKIGGSKVLKESEGESKDNSGKDELTIAATGITVFEALKAAEQLKAENISVRVVDCYSIKPVDKETLNTCANETRQRIIITVEDHYEHGGLGDYVLEAVDGTGTRVVKMAVTHISQSGKQDELLKDAGIDAASIVDRVKSVLK